MDFANRGGQSTQQQQPASNTGGMMPQHNTAPKREKSGGIDFGKAGTMFVLFGVALIAIMLVIVLMFGSKDSATTTVNSESELIKTDQYQAVFLNSQDGQVYFGKLGIYNPDLYVLTDIYYVRVENPIQPEGTNQTQQANISLAKLGAELHCPEDMMYISRDKVLYWENLQDKGQVVTAITEYQKSGRQVECNTKADQQSETQQQSEQNTTTETQQDATENTTQTEETQNP